MAAILSRLWSVKRLPTHVAIDMNGGNNIANPDSKVHGANMGSIWDRQDTDGPHVGPVNFAIWEAFHLKASAPMHVFRGLNIIAHTLIVYEVLCGRTKN